MEEWKKTVDLKEPSRNLVNLEIKKPEELESKFDHFDAANSCLSRAVTSWI